MINGKNYSWEDISVSLPMGQLINFDGIEYSDGKEIEEVYGKGSNPQGYGTGNYSASGKATLFKEDHDRLVAYAKAIGKAMYQIPPFPISVSYANEDQPLTSDILKACKIEKISHSGGQGDKSLKVEYEFKILNGIWRNGVAPN